MLQRTLLAAPLLLIAGWASSSCTATDSETGSNGTASLEVTTQEIAYEADGVSLTGFLARPEGASADAPGILVIHEWWGHNDYVRRRATELAELGYVAFALDMYGTGKSASHPEDASAFMNEVMGNADAMEARFLAALEVLNGQDGVDASRTGAIGYCMGGGIALRMARTSGKVDAVASFHGSVGAALDLSDSPGLTHALIANGADDPFVTAEQLEGITKQLEDSGVSSVTVLNHPGAVHGFTNPDATAKGEEFELPLRYDAKADTDSWAAMKAMFAEAF